MNGAESIVRTLLGAGVDTCFANPGTSEMHFVAALDRIPGMHCVLGLHENVVTGMADGYWRIARKPAATLLHCGPGLANGLANLHNARRARAGIVNLVGDQATYHRPLDAPLTADTEALARSTSAWVRTATRAADVGRDTAEAIAAAKTRPGQIATLILPSDTCWDDGGVVAAPLAPSPAPPLDPKSVEDAARLLRQHGEAALILLASEAVLGPAQRLAWRAARATGATIMADFINGHLQRGRGHVALERVPYVTDVALKALARFRCIILVGARPPVGFFAYPGKPSVHHDPSAHVHVLSRPEQDPVAALDALIAALGAPDSPIPDPGPRPEPAKGAISPEAFAQTLASVMPEQAIISDESVSFGRGFYKFTHAAPAHDWLHLAGGAIGDGLPVAAGAALAAGRQRRTISLQADGAGLYSLQALWTQAREKLPCTTVVFANRRYNILIGEYAGVGATSGHTGHNSGPGPNAMAMFDLGNPDIDWVRLANGFGVAAAKANSMESCADLMRASFKTADPFLIELVI